MSLFGINIDEVVTSALSGQLIPLTLTRKGQYPDGVTYDPVDDRYEDENGDPVSEPEDQTFTSEGIEPAISSIAGKAQMLQAGLITASEVPILIVAQPLGTEPVAGDEITINSKTYTITGIIEKDPAGASWTVKGEV